MEKLQSSRITLIVIGLVLMISLLVPGSGYGQFKPGEKRIVADGQELKVKGVILNRDGETFVLRDLSRTDTVVLLTDSTKIRTERKGIFRGHKPFDVTVLLPGLILQAKGKGDAQGRLVAEDITFSEADLKAAITSYAQTAPVAKNLSETDAKLTETSKEVVETNKRISSLDQYDVVKTVTVLFKVNSDKLGAEQKAQLDELASKAPGAKNYKLEVKGFADPTGDFDKNLALSQRRAEAVVQYLTVKHNVPLRRIEVPMGYGETKPVNKGETAAAREKSRRVEVSVLVNKGLNK
jgi:outer membrane protein OmpA-like peptidoglycan-associated protein